MRSIIKPVTYLAAPIAGLMAMVFIGHAAGSGTAALTLSPASGSYNTNTSFTVSIYENSGSTNINTVEADLTYNSSQLRYDSTDTSSSSFNTTVNSSGGGGSVKVTVAKLGGSVTGSQYVAKVTFTALNAGSAAINFAGSSLIVSSSTNQNVWNGNTAGGTYSLTAPASVPTTPPASAPSAAPSASHSSSSVPIAKPASGQLAPAATASAPAISNLKVTPGLNSVRIDWQTNQPVSGSVLYGTSNKYGLLASQPGSSLNHEIILNTPDITRGLSYYAEIISTNGAGQATAQTSFAVPGYDLVVQVVDSSNRPLAHVKVSIDQNRQLTSTNGQSTFHNLTAGLHQVIISGGGYSGQQTISLKPTNSQESSGSALYYSLSAAKAPRSPVSVIFIVLGLLLIAGGGLYVLLKVFLRQINTPSQPGQGPPQTMPPEPYQNYGPNNIIPPGGNQV